MEEEIIALEAFLEHPFIGITTYSSGHTACAGLSASVLYLKYSNKKENGGFELSITGQH